MSSSKKNLPPQTAVIPEGFATGRLEPGGTPYIMPHYMVPGWEHALLLESTADHAGAPAAPVASPYDAGEGPVTTIPEDVVSVPSPFHFHSLDKWP